VFKSNRRRPSAGTVIGVLALVLALTGGAYAAQELTKKQVTKIAKKQANKQINKRESGLNVNSAKTAANADRLGGKTLGEISLWVVWDQNGGPVRSSGGVTVTRVGEGRYKAVFPIDVSQCGYNVNSGLLPNASDSTNFGQSMAMVAPDAVDPKAVQVETARDDGVEQDTPGYMTVQC
jgi:hypothetical protein